MRCHLPDTQNSKRSILHPESELGAVVVEGNAAHGLLHVTASDQCVFRQTPESEIEERPRSDKDTQRLKSLNVSLQWILHFDDMTRE